MPRPIKPRFIEGFPKASYYKPIGVPLAELETVIIKIEEIEAIKLKDLYKIDQEEAAKKMNISRGTFQRILNEAREKITDALVNGKAIKIEGGNYKIIPGRCSKGMKKRFMR